MYLREKYLQWLWWHWARLKLGTRDLIQGPRDQLLESSPAAFQGPRWQEAGVRSWSCYQTQVL